MVHYFEWTLIGLTLVLVTATLLPLSKLRLGGIKGLAFLRIQVLWAAVLLSIAALFMSSGYWLAWVLAATALVQLGYVVKFTPVWRCQSLNADDGLRGQTQRHIALLAANVKISNRNYPALIALVVKHKPHIVMAIEVDDDWIAELQDALGDMYPHWINVPKDTGYGLCVMSSLPLSHSEVREIVTKGVPSVRTVVTMGCGNPMRLYVVHPEPPVIGHDTKGRDSEISLVGIEAANDRLPAIVTGDLNDVAWSTTTRSFQRLSGLLDPRIGRGFYNTFSAYHWWARWPLDHLFHDPQFRLISMTRLPKIGSDHFPMLFALALAQAPVQDGDTGAADAQERAEVEEMITQERNRGRRPIGTDWEDKNQK